MNAPPLPDAFEPLYLAAAIAYGLALLAEPFRPAVQRVALVAGVTLHLAGIIVRGVAIEYFPLTSKFESFYAFAFFCFLVLASAPKADSRVHRLGLFVVGGLFYGLTLLFSYAPTEAPPLMRTIWYPLHVPASFLAYALWTSAATAGLAVLCGHRGPGPRRAVERHAFWGFAVFSISMIFGGAWGYVAWGAWFLWDPKLVWSLITWLFYGAFVHLKYWPAGNAPRPKAWLAVVGLLVVMVTYIGTSFIFGHSSHSF